MLKFLSQTLVEIATETDNTEKRFIAKWRQHFDNNRYFRFSVDQGLQHIKLTEYQEQGAIEAATDGYLDHQAQGFRVRDCVRNLKLKQNVSATDISRMLAIGATPTHSIDMLEKIRKDRSDLKYRCDMWLKPSNMREIYNNQIREKLLGTCEWIWSHSIFSEWSSNSTYPAAVDRRLLCIYGTHGCGKTVLASSIVESLRNKGKKVFFFSFSGADTSRQTLDNLARSLLWQVLQESISDESFDIMRDLMSRGQPLTSELWTTFKDITISISGLIYWVIDGVDECKESGEELFNQVIDLLTANKNARAVLLGRTHVLQPINQTNYAIEITPSLIEPDIDAFINTEIDRSTILQSPQVRALAFKTLRDGSQGMFLWVKLMVRDLCKSSSKAEVIQRLHNMPQGLQKAYRHFLSQLVEDLDGVDLRFTQRLLAFVIAARRPLKIEELRYAQALATRSDLKTSHECSLEDCMLEDIAGKVLRICGSFMQITDGVVSLVHISAKEFLTRPESEWSCDGNHKIIDLRVDLEESHYLFVSTCIDYLEIGKYGFPLQDQDEWLMLYGVHQFLEYSSKNLIYHINRARKFSIDVVNKFDQYFRSEASLSWVEYFAIHLVEDGSSGVEAEEFKTWIENGAEDRFLEHVNLHLRRQLENIKQSFGENDRRTDYYRLFLGMMTDDDTDESTSSVSDYHTSTPDFAIHTGTNDIRQTVPMMTKILNQNSVLPAPKQLELFLRLRYHIQRAKTLTDPLELLFRLILRNAGNVSVYVLLIIGNFYERVDQSEKALQVYYSIITKFGDREVPMKYRIWSAIGSTNYDLDRYQEAEEAYQQAAEGLGKILGQGHPDTLSAMDELGCIFQDQAKDTEAEETFQKVLKEEQRVYGPEHSYTLITMRSLGRTLYNQKKYAEAQEIFQREVQGRQKIHGLEHLGTLLAIQDLGETFNRQEKYAEAEETLQHVIKGRQKRYGAECRIPFETLNELGIAFYGQGKYERAEEMYQQARKGWENLYGPEDRDTLEALYNLAKVFNVTGRYLQAEEMYRRVLKGYEKAFGLEDARTLQTICELGYAFENQAKDVQAKEMYQRAAKGREKTLGPNHKDTLHSMEDLKYILGCLEDDEWEGEQMRALFG
ncbi:TPR-like protein [Daldinia vernicosa]|uniref:TPR-like protein n=1 Tax=Daldinia vernicosa TaxID=114800 RepID=UPI0020076D36|nr:TPR-like protein [Daldinia vernicosa]KAI0845106.1 TPR-like protein [Daldinia vernicosa]